MPQQMIDSADLRGIIGALVSRPACDLLVLSITCRMQDFTMGGLSKPMQRKLLNAKALEFGVSGTMKASTR
jgi:hypothetical protein